MSSPNASCLCEGEYGFDGWNEDLVGLADVGGVGYVVTEGCFEDLSKAGDFEVELDLFTEDLKCVPGPVSSLGSGAFKGSSRYLVAWQMVSKTWQIDVDRLVLADNKLECLSARPHLSQLTQCLSSWDSILAVVW